MSDTLQRRDVMLARIERKPWQPGFATRAEAVRRGKKNYVRANGLSGVENRHFHVVQAESGRWMIEDGPATADQGGERR